MVANSYHEVSKTGGPQKIDYMQQYNAVTISCTRLPMMMPYLTIQRLDKALPACVPLYLDDGTVSGKVQYTISDS